MSDESNQGSTYGKKLVLLSVTIILYYAAGGSLQDEARITLQVINVDIDRPWVVFLFVWLLLAWFLLQFFIDINFKVSTYLGRSYGEYLVARKREYLETKLSDKYGAEYRIASVFDRDPCSQRSNGEWIARVNGKVDKSNIPDTMEEVVVETPYRDLRYFGWMTYNRPEFREYFLPIITSMFAIGTGIISLFV